MRPARNGGSESVAAQAADAAAKASRAVRAVCSRPRRAVSAPDSGKPSASPIMKSVCVQVPKLGGTPSPPATRGSMAM